MTDHVVGTTDELEPGARLLVQIDGREIAVFNVEGSYSAYLNWCPHQAGPICEGATGGSTRASFDRDTLEYELDWVAEGRVIRCPWHSWEFDLETGESLHDSRISLPSYPVRVEDDLVVVSCRRNL